MTTELMTVLLSGSFLVIGTILGAYLNKRGSLSVASEISEIEKSKYIDNHIWDMRKKAYTEILYHLGDASRYADLVDDGYHLEEMHPEAYHSTKHCRDTEKKLQCSLRQCSSAFEQSKLILSNSFVQYYEDMQKEVNALSENSIPPMIAWQVNECLARWYSKLFETAKAEIATVTGKTV